MGRDSYPGLAFFSWFNLLASCQTLFSELNRAWLRSQPQQERFASCSASDQTSARMSTRTAGAPQKSFPSSWAHAERVATNTGETNG